MITLALLGLASAGTLEGVVRDPDGEPLRNVTVVVYDHRLAFRNQSTGLDGAWAFHDLEPGRWRVRVVPSPLDNLQEQWVGGGLQVCLGTRFDPVGGEAPVEITLAPGAMLEGVVTDGAGVPVGGAQVSARPIAAPTAFLRAAQTNADGRFSVRGLTIREEGSSIYRLEVARAGWPTQSLPGTYVPADAAQYMVTPGQVLDVGEHVLREGVVVGGTVAGPGGPVAAGIVRAHSGNQVVDAPLVDGVWAASGLPPGEILVWARAAGHATTWWPDADRPGQRVVVGADGDIADDLHIAMPLQGVLMGRVVGDGDVAGLNVLAYNDDRTVAVGAVTDDAGRFAIERLHGGTFTLYAYGGGNGFVEGWVGGADPATFDVPAQTTTPERVVDLALGAALEGTARDKGTGEPVYGVTVHMVSQDTGEARSVTTRRDGAFALVGLPAGTWKVWAEYQHYCPSDPGWAPQYYPDQVNPALVGLVRLRAGDVHAWDPRMPPDHDHDGMDDLWEVEHGLDPTRDDSAEDLDGDGFTNLDEYLLGTDPSGGTRLPEGCEGCGGGRPSPWFVLVLPWALRRRLG